MPSHFRKTATSVRKVNSTTTEVRINPSLRVGIILALAICGMVAALTVTMTGSAQIGAKPAVTAPTPKTSGVVSTTQSTSIQPSGAIPKLIAPATPAGATALHFHGNPDDIGTPAPCTGSSPADISGCGGPFLKPSGTLFAGPAAVWNANSALNQNVERSTVDPNWIWNLAGSSTTLRGDMEIQWWGTCGACAPGIFDAEWDITLWGDGVNKFTAHIIGPTPATPNVPSLLSATINIPSNITASNRWVLVIDPVYSDTQANTKIYYDSTLPCPGASGSAPCDSKVTMPVVDPLATPTLSIDDVLHNEGNGGSTTYTFTVSLSTPALQNVTFNIATANDTATTADNDYVNKSLTAQTIPTGQQSYTFDVVVNGDLNVEPNETFFVNVSNVSAGATVADGQGIGTILNDDGNTTYSATPRYFNYVAPLGVGGDSGEPSIGINWNTEQTFSNSMFAIPNGGTSNYFGGFSTSMLKVTFDDCASPASATWEQKELLVAGTPRALGDPILYTDHVTGRTFVSQLEGGTKQSTTEYTDDDGNNFSPSQGSGINSGVDHQTFGGGPFAPNAPSHSYPRAVYYCAQDIADANCALSTDGGVTFGPAVPMYTIADCGGLHGHVKVAPDGTAYVPNNSCGSSKVGLIVSTDNGMSWAVKTLPQSTSDGQWDPSVGLASDGTVYVGYRDGQGRARTAVSHDTGTTWTNDQDVGAQLGLKRIAFPAVVAGDPDRAAFAFYGTTTDVGNDHVNEADGTFSGIWYLYISSTFDGGQTWTTVNATPGDPIQRGAICDDGNCRNMLDFFGAEIDKEGRVLVGWDDGCTDGCVNGPPNSYTSKASITRQSGGKRMFATYDPVEPVLAGAPNITGSINGAGTAISLSWPVPDNGGAPITEYKVYRREGGVGQPFTLIGTINEAHYIDTTFNETSSVEKAYRVTAVNAIGEGPYCHEFIPPVGPTETPCELPGIRVIHDFNSDGTDADSGQNTPADGSVNVRDLFVAEPFLGVGVNKLVFKLQVAPSLLASPPPNSQWYIVWNRLNPDTDFDRWYVAMKTDANGVASWEYGKFGVPLDTSGNNVPNPNSNTPVKLGDADIGTYDVTTGVIEIRLSTSKAENIHAGQSLSGLNVRTYLNRPDPGQRSQNNASDITGDSSYTLIGNAACATNQLPTAHLVATTPTTGPAPLTVSFDASGSTDPDGTVVEYRFNFGDGTPTVTQASPTIMHTYAAGSFFATLTVKDNSGGLSANTASVPIEAQDVSGGVNYALSSRGSVATASSEKTSPRSYPPMSTIDGDTTGLNWESSGGWADATRDVWPDWLAVTFGGGAKTINEVWVWTLQNNYQQPVVPDENSPADVYGIEDFEVQVPDAQAPSGWRTVATVTGNTKVLSKVVLPSPETTTAIRINVTKGRVYYSRIVEVQAYGAAGQ